MYVDNSQDVENDVIDLPTAEEINAMDRAFAKSEANNNSEQGFIVANDNNGKQIISETKSRNSLSRLATGENFEELRKSGITNIQYDAHVHGAVFKFNGENSFSFSLPSANPGTNGDQGFSKTNQAKVILGYDMTTSLSKFSAADIDKAVDNVGRWTAVSNPKAFNKIISFYNNSNANINSLPYEKFKNLVQAIR